MVIQDRRCAVTGLQNQSKSVVKNKPKVKTKSTAKTTQVKAPSTRAYQPRTNQRRISSPAKHHQQWQSAIPANWQMLSQKRSLQEHWWFSQSPIKQYSDFRQGVRVTLYKDTVRSNRKVAFAQALALYHEVRNDPENQLLDSGFKSHERYKVFNIKYLRNEHVVLSEYYVDESSNQLYVLTIQAKQSKWSAPQQLAATIMRSL